jgi:hypothetical protein
MGFFFRQGVISVLFGILLFCVACEKHPVGQMPDMQREQPDPAKEWSESGKAKSENPASSKRKSQSAADEAR